MDDSQYVDHLLFLLTMNTLLAGTNACVNIRFDLCHIGIHILLISCNKQKRKEYHDPHNNVQL